MTYLGSRSLDKINSQAVRTWRKRLLDDGRTPIIAAKSYRLLRAVLNTAVQEDRLLAENPCRMRGYDKEETAERPVGSALRGDRTVRADRAAVSRSRAVRSFHRPALG